MHSKKKLREKEAHTNQSDFNGFWAKFGPELPDFSFIYLFHFVYFIHHFAFHSFNSVHSSQSIHFIRSIHFIFRFYSSFSFHFIYHEVHQLIKSSLSFLSFYFIYLIHYSLIRSSIHQFIRSFYSFSLFISFILFI